ncbi:hypothetical protein [Neobacillus drentensis]|uniref:hypothetical protein n=1 Tax=Neobacillus drentensis TaxID=220684 RepID=UPI002FFE1E73
MNFIVKNLYKSNPDATVTPKEKVNGKYATDFFNMLGIAIPINTLKNKSESGLNNGISNVVTTEVAPVKSK